MTTLFEGKPDQTLEITIPVTLTWHQDYSKGGLHMHMGALEITTGEGKEKVYIGAVNHAIPAGTLILFSKDSPMRKSQNWYIHPRDIWNALVAALGYEDMAITPKETSS